MTNPFQYYLSKKMYIFSEEETKNYSSYTPILKWWLIFCVTLISFFSASYFFGLHLHLWESDATKISFIILGVFVFSSAWVGKITHVGQCNQNVGWFIAESLLGLGMIGTVTGFLLMLGTAFENIDVSNTETLQNALTQMALGMSTALYTTLIGLICSLILKIQLVNYETSYDYDS